MSFGRAEAYKIMTREKIDLASAVDREAPAKVIGVVTSEADNSPAREPKNLR